MKQGVKVAEADPEETKDDSKIIKKLLKNTIEHLDDDSEVAQTISTDIVKSYTDEFKLANQCLYSLIDDLPISLISNQYCKEKVKEFSYMAKATLNRLNEAIDNLEANFNEEQNA